jgi:hypothetical protein
VTVLPHSCELCVWEILGVGTLSTGSDVGPTYSTVLDQYHSPTLLWCGRTFGVFLLQFTKHCCHESSFSPWQAASVAKEPTINNTPMVTTTTKICLQKSPPRIIGDYLSSTFIEIIPWWKATTRRDRSSRKLQHVFCCVNTQCSVSIEVAWNAYSDQEQWSRGDYWLDAKCCRSFKIHKQKEFAKINHLAMLLCHDGKVQFSPAI